MKTVSGQVHYSPHRIKDSREEQRYYEELRYRLARKLADEICKSDDIFKVRHDVSTDSMIIEASVTIAEAGDMVSPKRMPEIKPVEWRQTYYDEIVEVPFPSPVLPDLRRKDDNFDSQGWFEIYKQVLEEQIRKNPPKK